jgi:hypothetical protein
MGSGELNGRAGRNAHRGNISACSRARVTQAQGAGAESVDEGAVLGAEFKFSLFVEGVNKVLSRPGLTFVAHNQVDLRWKLALRMPLTRNDPLTGTCHQGDIQCARS